jgi:hypothetical protein
LISRSNDAIENGVLDKKKKKVSGTFSAPLSGAITVGQSGGKGT